MRIYRLAAKMAEVEGRIAPPSATSAADAALGLRPRRALSSAQLPLEWTTTTLLRNGSSIERQLPPYFRVSRKGCSSILKDLSCFIPSPSQPGEVHP
jgi:hypothetical protein